MPLLPSPRKLKRGAFWPAQCKFGDEWHLFNTHCQNKKIAQSVCDFIEFYCGSLEQAKEFVKKLKGKPDNVIRDALKEMREEFKAGENPFKGKSKQTISELRIAYTEARKPFVAGKTLRAYKDSLNHLESCLGQSFRVSAIGNAEVVKFRTALLADMKPESVNHYLRHFKAFLNWCARDGGLDGYKVPKIEFVKAISSVHKDYYTVEECKLILNAAEGRTINGVSFKVFLTILIATGMRLGEVAEMRWTWINSQRCLINIPAEFTKTNKKRSVPISKEILQLLYGLPNSFERIFPFSTESGYLNEVWRDITKSAEVRYLKLHNLRDTHIVNGLIAGVSAFIIAKNVGNSVNVIEKNYSAIAGEEIATAMKMMQPFVADLLQ